MLRLLWAALAIVVADRLTKMAALEHLAQRPPVEVLPFFDLVLVFNTGAAFGLLRDAGGWQNTVFIAFALLVSAFIVYALARARRDDLQVAVALALILGGALGNVVDRLLYGYVVDFIDLHYRVWHWPAFNIADAAITVGAVLLVLDTLGWKLIRPRRS